MPLKPWWSWPAIAGVILALPHSVIGQPITEQPTGLLVTSNPAVTATIPAQPSITFLGVARADYTLVAPIGTTADGIPIYQRAADSGFALVVEGRPGAMLPPLGTSAFSDDVTQLPDLQVEVSRPLGDGSPAVCDDTVGNFGGVPAVSPFDFSPAAAPAINDLACRFKDGQGQPVGRKENDACTLFLPEGQYHFVDADSRIQFCGFVDGPLSFPSGDTIVAACLRDVAGNLSPVAQIVVRIADATPTATWTPTAMGTRAATRTPTAPPNAPPTSTAPSNTTRTPTALPNTSPTPTAPPNTTPMPSPTVSGTIPAEPSITFLGVARADYTLVAPIGTTADGIPIYQRAADSGFALVVEGRPGAMLPPLGTSAFSDDVTQLPDLQVEVSRPLGDGSPAVCDDTVGNFGGVPAVSPFDFSPAAAPAINDLACRFKDGQGHPVGREENDACTLFLPEGQYHFVDPASAIQFCSFVDGPLSFPSGDTVVAARLRDVADNVSTVAQIVVRIADATPTTTWTPTAMRTRAATRTPTALPNTSPTPTAPPNITPTPMPSPTVSATIPAEPSITFLGVARADYTLVAPIGSTADGIPIYRTGDSGFALVVEGRPGAMLPPLGTSAFSDDVTQLPDLQVQVSRPLGNGSPAVCDDAAGNFGGVPAVSPFDFSPAVVPAINDLACRFKDGQGRPVGRNNSNDACTLFLAEGQYHFVDPASTIQFCGFVDGPLSFPSGDTVVAARLRDVAGNLSPVVQLIVRTTSPSPVVTVTHPAIATPTRTAGAVLTVAPANSGGSSALRLGSGGTTSGGCTLVPAARGTWSGVILTFLPPVLLCWRHRRHGAGELRRRQ